MIKGAKEEEEEEEEKKRNIKILISSTCRKT
jgi:hypothetical protein